MRSRIFSLEEVLHEAIEVYGQPDLAVLKHAEAGTVVPDLFREHGIGRATFYKWRSEYGGMDVSLMTRMKELEEENRRLKKLYIAAQIKADIVAKPSQKNSEAISPTRGGQVGGRGEGPEHPSGLRGVWIEREWVSISAEAQRRERQDRRVAATTDGEPAELGIWSVFPVSAERERLSVEPQARISDLQGAEFADQA